MVDYFDLIIGSFNLLDPGLHRLDRLMHLPSLLDEPRLFLKQLLYLIIFILNVNKLLVAFVCLNCNFLFLLLDGDFELHQFWRFIIHRLLVQLLLHFVELYFFSKLLDVSLLLICFVLLLMSFLPNVFKILRVLDNLMSWLRLLGFNLKFCRLLFLHILKFDKHSRKNISQRTWVLLLNTLVYVFLS